MGKRNGESFSMLSGWTDANGWLPGHICLRLGCHPGAGFFSIRLPDLADE
jgi:hypothetical protein